MTTTLMIMLLLTAVVLKSFKKIPSKHFAVPNVLGGRMKGDFMGGYLSEGWKMVIPFVFSFPDDQIYSIELDDAGFNIELPTKDNKLLRSDWKIFFIRDPRIKDNSPKRYVQISNIQSEKLKPSLEDDTKEEIKNLTNVYDAEKFRDKYTDELVLLLNSVMRCKNIPHMKPITSLKEDEYLEISPDDWDELVENFKEETEGNVTEIADNPIPINYRLEFYSVFSNLVREKLNKESGNPEEHSDNELFYGIDIKKVVNSDIDYTDPMKQAMEEKEISRNKLDGKVLYHKRASEIANEIRENSEKVSYEEAYDRALVILDKARFHKYKGLENSRTLMGVDNE